MEKETQRPNSPYCELSRIQLNDDNDKAGKEIIKEQEKTLNWAEEMNEFIINNDKKPTTYADAVKNKITPSLNENVNNNNSENDNNNNNSASIEEKKNEEKKEYIIFKFTISTKSLSSDDDTINKKEKICTTLSNGEKIEWIEIENNDNDKENTKTFICLSSDFDESSINNPLTIISTMISQKLPSNPLPPPPPSSSSTMISQKLPSNPSPLSTVQQQQHHHHYYCYHHQQQQQQQEQHNPIPPPISKRIIGDKNKFGHIVGKQRRNIMEIEKKFSVTINVPKQYDLSNEIIVQGFDNENVNNAVKEIENQLQIEYEDNNNKSYYYNKDQYYSFKY